jgi:hypothetical protein
MIGVSSLLQWARFRAVVDGLFKIIAFVVDCTTLMVDFTLGLCFVPLLQDNVLLRVECRRRRSGDGHSRQQQRRRGQCDEFLPPSHGAAPVVSDGPARHVRDTFVWNWSHLEQSYAVVFE